MEPPAVACALYCATATSLPPSADDATSHHERSLGALVGIQLAPESTDVNMPPLTATATNLVPSAEDAMEFHCLLGAPRKLQVPPAFVEV